jgi:hypothetical protein
MKEMVVHSICDRFQYRFPSFLKLTYSSVSALLRVLQCLSIVAPRLPFAPDS